MEHNTGFEYYLIMPSDLGTTPLLMKDSSVDGNDINYLYSLTPAPQDSVSYLQFKEPFANVDIDTDFFSLDSFCVFSDRIKTELVKHTPIKNVEFVPAVIKDNSGKTIENFWIANVYQDIQCFDSKLSKFGGLTSRGRWRRIEKLVLNREELIKIPLENRLAFMAKESSRFELFHKSIVDIIRSLDPKGIRFLPVEEWHESVYFDS